MRFFKRLLDGVRTRRNVAVVKEWYADLASEQQVLLRRACPDLDPAELSDASQNAGGFIVSCAQKVAVFDLNFAEQLYHQALEIEHDPIHHHEILENMAKFYKHRATNPTKYFKTIQDDLSLMRACVKAWRKREGGFLPEYPAAGEMVRILRNRGDLPEALALCKRVRKMGLEARVFDMADLWNRMQDD